MTACWRGWPDDGHSGDKRPDRGTVPSIPAAHHGSGVGAPVHCRGTRRCSLHLLRGVSIFRRIRPAFSRTLGHLESLVILLDSSCGSLVNHLLLGLRRSAHDVEIDVPGSWRWPGGPRHCWCRSRRSRKLRMVVSSGRGSESFRTTTLLTGSDSYSRSSIPGSLKL